jgi:arylsulfatase A-like enzyme
MRTCLLLSFSLLLLVGVATADEGDAKSARPNVLLIVADDLGYSDIGCFGGEVSTPTLDKLAAEGIRFSNFHVLPTCSPSRSVLLSGTDNHVAGLGTMGEFKSKEMAEKTKGYPGYAGYLNFEVAALPEVLKASGYHTYMAGKWHLGETPETVPQARGFEKAFALIPGGGSHWSDRRKLSPPQTMVYRRNGEEVKSLPEDFYSTKDYTNFLLECLRKDATDGKPFFAFLSYTAPHDPLHAPREYIDRYKGKYDPGWDALRAQRLARLQDLGYMPKGAVPFPRLPSVKAWETLSEEERKKAARDMEVYAAMIDYMDEQIARVIEYLKETGEYDNTLIFFLSDNGANGALPTAYPGQTEEFLASFDNSLENRGLPGSYIEPGPGWAQASMTPCRMFKGFTTEGGIRAPLIVKLPGHMATAGKTSHALVHIRDIMPTILAASGIEPPTKFKGREVQPLQGGSLLDVAAGEAPQPYPGSDHIGYELFGLKAYLAGNLKALWLPKPFGPGTWQLFDLNTDPGEMKDLAGAQPGKLAELVALWEQYKRDNKVLDIALDLASKVKTDDK